MNKLMVAALVLVLIGALGAWYYYTKTQPTANPNTTATSSQSASSLTAVTITYTANGFSPTSVVVKSGGEVTITNSSSQPMQLNSNPHPIHTDNPQLNLGLVNPGESKTVTLTTPGTWGYHNHLNPAQRGTIIVQ